jgi:hypothetical protein
MTMTVERFAQLAEIHGGDTARWPEACREEARASLVADPETLGPILAEAAHLDRLLDLAPAGAVNSALLGRLIAAAPQPVSSALRWIAGLGAALGLATAAFAGVAVGVAVGHDQPVASQAQVVIATDFTSDLSEALEEPAEL